MFKFLHLSVRGMLGLVVLALLFFSPASRASMVSWQTSLGVIDIELFDSAAPTTVANFLAYANSGDYNNSGFHRSVPGFILQGGGYTWDSSNNTFKTIPSRGPIINEFSASRSNVRGTIAMAKLGGDPNSASSQWFINLGDNAANLDTQNGGFTVFGQVTAASMAVVDAIAALPIVSAGGAFSSLPVLSVPSTGVLHQENLVLINAMSTAAVVWPQSGYWWNPAEAGRGFVIEKRGANIFFAGFLYEGSGRSTWLVASGAMAANGKGFSGKLDSYSGGQTLTGAWKAPLRQAAAGGDVTLAFADSRHGTLSWSGGTVALERFEFAPNGLSAPRRPDQPESGWWWSPGESGRGFSLEFQGDSLFVAGYMYDSSGNPVWYTSMGTLSGKSFQGAWAERANGQTQTGAYREPSITNANVGSLAIVFSSPTTAVLTLPDQRQIAIERFRF